MATESFNMWPEPGKHVHLEQFMKEIVILKTGDSIPSLVTRRGDFEDWIISGMGGNHLPIRVIPVHKGETPPEYPLIAGIVITGSHDSVTDQAGWSERTGEWLLRAIESEIPILGICYGHQLLAYALGGRVGNTPGGPEFGTVPISMSDAASEDPILGTLPRQVEVQTSHFQAILELPSNATPLASSQKDAYSAFRYDPFVWGVQFHPEYDADITSAYIREFRGAIEESHMDFNRVLGNCKDTATGGLILKRFARLVAGELT
jgi:GMP synthase (glutamine-hydrolysing)